MTDNIRFIFDDTDEDGDPNGDTIEVEMTPEQAESGAPVAYIVNDVPSAMDDHGHALRIDSVVPDPRDESRKR